MEYTKTIANSEVQFEMKNKYSSSNKGLYSDGLKPIACYKML